MDPKREKKLFNLCTKITNVYTDFYILKTGYILSLDKEKPFLIQLSDDYVSLFNELKEGFKILHITDVRAFKKDMTTCIEEVTIKPEINKITTFLEERLNLINSSSKWEDFKMSDSICDNEKIILSIFKNNDYIEFKPKTEKEIPNLILTKSLLPLVTEKNYTKLYYNTREINKDLYLIIFDFDYDLFRLFMFHYYIPYDKN